MRQYGLRSIGFAMAAAAVLVLAGSASYAQRMSAQNPGETIYAFAGTDTNGKKISSSDYKGKIVLLDFWATWCPPCRAEAPNVAKVYKEFRTKGFDVLGVSLDRDQAKLKPFTDQTGMPWPEIYDAKQAKPLAALFQVKAIPTCYLFDGTTGKIIAKDLRGEALRTTVAKAVAAIPKKKR